MRSEASRDKHDQLRRTDRLGTLSVAASAATWLCCTVPILMVVFGLGAALAALTSALPFIIVLSGHKLWIFTVSGSILLLAYFLDRRSRDFCPTEPESAARCARSQRHNRFMIRLSAVIWIVGFAVTYFALPLRIWLDV